MLQFLDFLCQLLNLAYLFLEVSISFVQVLIKFGDYFLLLLQNLLKPSQFSLILKFLAYKSLHPMRQSIDLFPTVLIDHGMNIRDLPLSVLSVALQHPSQLPIFAIFLSLASLDQELLVIHNSLILLCFFFKLLDCIIQLLHDSSIIDSLALQFLQFAPQLQVFRRQMYLVSGELLVGFGELLPLLACSLDEFLIRQLFVMQVENLRLFRLDFFLQTVDFGSEDFSFILEFVVGLFELNSFAFQEHLHPLHLFAEDLADTHSIIHGYLHILLFEGSYGIQLLQFVFDCPQITNDFGILFDAVDLQLEVTFDQLQLLLQLNLSVAQLPILSLDHDVSLLLDGKFFLQLGYLGFKFKANTFEGSHFFSAQLIFIINLFVGVTADIDDIVLLLYSLLKLLHMILLDFYLAFEFFVSLPIRMRLTDDLSHLFLALVFSVNQSCVLPSHLIKFLSFYFDFFFSLLYNLFQANYAFFQIFNSNDGLLYLSTQHDLNLSILKLFLSFHTQIREESLVLDPDLFVGIEHRIYFLFKLETQINLVIEGLVGQLQSRLTDIIISCHFGNSVALLIDLFVQLRQFLLVHALYLIKLRFLPHESFLQVHYCLEMAFLHDLEHCAV